MDITASKIYAKEFLFFMKEQNLKELCDEISILIRSLSPIEIINYLKSPTIDNEKKILLIKSLTKDKNLINLAAILAKRKRIKDFVYILNQIIILNKAQNNIRPALVTSVVSLNKKQLNNICKLVKEIFDFDIEIENKLDNKIVGGLMIEVGDYLVDLSIRKQLELMEQKIFKNKSYAM